MTIPQSDYTSFTKLSLPLSLSLSRIVLQCMRSSVVAAENFAGATRWSIFDIFKNIFVSNC